MAEKRPTPVKPLTIYFYHTRLTRESYEEWKEEYLKEDVVTYAISFNGKARYNLEIPADTPREEIEKMVLNHESSVRWLEGKTPKKIIVVPNKIVNIVI